MVSVSDLPVAAWGCLFTALLGAVLMFWTIAPGKRTRDMRYYAAMLALILNVVALFVVGVRYPTALFATLLWATGGEVHDIGYMVLLLVAVLANTFMVALSYADAWLLSRDDAVV